MDGTNGKNLAFGLLMIVFSFWSLSMLREHLLSRSPASIQFCDVGQGDGAHIRIHPDIDILIDVGPDEKIVQCVARGMPHADRIIDVIVLTHFQQDHSGGLQSVFDRYSVKTLILPPFTDSKKKVEDVVAMLSKSNQVTILEQGAQMSFGKTSLDIIWPKRNVSGKATSEGVVVTKDDLNTTSYVILMSLGKSHVLFTGDAYGDTLDRLRNTSCGSDACIPASISILKVPHHGAKNGVSTSFYDETHIEEAIISAGKKNTFGHPSTMLMDILSDHKIPSVITFNSGDIRINFTSEGRWYFPQDEFFWRIVD